ncbi:MAG TPA: hypothetical protein VGT05_03675 [Patescibacteria group bacterium]|nr:hypothetical protein [Patescibacteria group bacterium]
MKSHILKRSFVFFFFLSLCIIINISTLLTAAIINKAYAADGQVNPSSPFAQSELSALQTNNPNGYFGTSLRAITLFIIAGTGV